MSSRSRVVQQHCYDSTQTHIYSSLPSLSLIFISATTSVPPLRLVAAPSSTLRQYFFHFLNFSPHFCSCQYVSAAPALECGALDAKCGVIFFFARKASKMSVPSSTLRTREAKLSEQAVSEASDAQGDAQTSISALLSPPRESACVSIRQHSV